MRVCSSAYSINAPVTAASIIVMGISIVPISTAAWCVVVSAQVEVKPSCSCDTEEEKQLNTT